MEIHELEDLDVVFDLVDRINVGANICLPISCFKSC